jgi:hypothetical protein
VKKYDSDVTAHRSAMAHDRHQWCNSGPTPDEQERSAVLRTPREVTPDRAADLDCVADLGHIVEKGRDLAVIKAFDDELVEPLKPGGRRNRVASLSLIAIWCREPKVEVLPRPEGAPGLGAKEKALYPLRLALDPFDHSLLPLYVTCL